ncbi:hypothetical protein, partial [Streptomyces sp. NPDC047070]|uniref:hypothetical protein n=1 Tax=Streptomyces sp. NPDC047070 TaxID=3154923 RepID=UPI003454895D
MAPLLAAREHLPEFPDPPSSHLSLAGVAGFASAGRTSSAGRWGPFAQFPAPLGTWAKTDGRLHLHMDSHSDGFTYVKSVAGLMDNPA